MDLVAIVAAAKRSLSKNEQDRFVLGPLLALVAAYFVFTEWLILGSDLDAFREERRHGSWGVSPPPEGEPVLWDVVTFPHTLLLIFYVLLLVWGIYMTIQMLFFVHPLDAALRSVAHALADSTLEFRTLNDAVLQGQLVAQYYLKTLLTPCVKPIKAD